MRAIIRGSLKIGVLFLLYQWINSIFSIIGSLANEISFSESPSTSRLTYVGIYTLVMVLEGIIIFLIWRKSDGLANWITGDSGYSELVINVSESALYQIMLRVLGMYFLVTGISGLAGHFALFLTADYVWAGAQLETGWLNNEIRLVTTQVTIILLGLWLFIGNERILSAYRRATSFIKE